MSSRLNRMWLMPLLLLASQAWALGLGDIRLSSALNEPLRAEIELLAASADELTNLTIVLASAETFQRYDLDRPLFLTRLQFNIVRSGTAEGNIVRVTSSEPVTEPFITFLVEASWSSGRLLREYTLLLDPPTFAPPPVTSTTQAVTAPSRATPADSGQIQRPAPQPQTAPPPSPAPIQAPTQTRPAQPAQPAQAEPAPTPARADFDSTPGADLVVQRGDTLWGIASRVRPDSRLTMNQTMLAIYQANPSAFNGNINRLRAGGTLRIPSADDVFRISRGDALAEVQRQNAAWSGQPGIAPVAVQPSLTLVPPDEEDDLPLTDTTVDTGVADVVEDEFDDVIVDPVEARIREIEALLQDQDALINIPDNELAALRAELADLRGEELPVEDEVDEFADDEILDDEFAEDEVFVDDEAEDIGVGDEELPVIEDTTPEVDTTPAVVTAVQQEDSIVDTIIGYLSSFWVWIGAALLATVALLVWFMRRAAGGGDEDVTGVWEALDVDDVDAESVASTERLRALAREDEESIMVVEAEPQPDVLAPSDTMEVPLSTAPVAPEIPAAPPAEVEFDDSLADTDTNKALEDTFSSETAINLDQSDPVAEADFHMAYGLYDQAADLINGALAADPSRQDLLAKLCEIYFVWGNRDAFIDAAGRFKTLAGAESNPDWDKIVIMGQQIAADHEMFSGVSAEGVTKAVDLSFEGGMDEDAALDMDFAGGADGLVSDVIDLGAEIDADVPDDTGQVPIAPAGGSGIDFSFDEEPDIEASVTQQMPEPTLESPTVEMPANDETAEIPASDEASSFDTTETPVVEETPTIEQQFDMDATGELPGISGEAGVETDATAEIDLDDLGLDLDGLEESADIADFADADDLAETGRNLAIDHDALEVTGTNEILDVDEALAATSEMPAIDEGTGITPALGDDEATLLASLDDEDDDTDVGIDTSLLDATGQTQILTEDMAVETGSDFGAGLSDEDATMLGSAYDEDPTQALPEDAETLVASVDEEDEDEGEFDFAKTEALPKDVFSPDMSTDETGSMPDLAGSTDMDLDLDDLTAALKVSEVGDTVNQVRDDATVEQPRIRPEEADPASTQALAPEDMSGDLHEARTMTEVGTKLDLARAYVDMGDPGGARSILEEVLDEGDEGQKQQARQLLESLPG